MSRRRLAIVVGRRAAEQIEEANNWWRANRQAGPEALSEELVRAFDLVSREPGVGVPAESRRLRGVRRILLPRVDYFLFYRVAPRRKELHILAFWHARRGSWPSL